MWRFFLLLPIYLFCGSLDEGIRLFQKKEYLQAAQLFQQIEKQDDFATAAYFGEGMCFIALGDLQRGKEALSHLASSMVCDCTIARPPDTEEEHKASYECRYKIREVTTEMRHVVEKLVRQNVDGFLKKIQTLRELYPFIDALERVGLDCCALHHQWDCCIDPLEEQLRIWKDIGLE